MTQSPIEPAPAAPRWQRRPEARPEEILRAALQSFVERGFAATKLEDVGARAGVSKGTVYLYFNNKEDLFRSTVRASVLPYIESGEERIAGYQGDPLELLRELFDHWVGVVTDPLLGGLTKLIVSEAGNFPEVARFYMDEVVKRTRALFAAVVQRCMDAGRLRPAPVDYVVRDLTAPILFATLWRHSLASHDDTPLDFPRYLDFHFSLVLQGLRPDAGALP